MFTKPNQYYYFSVKIYILILLKYLLLQGILNYLYFCYIIVVAFSIWDLYSNVTTIIILKKFHYTVQIYKHRHFSHFWHDCKDTILNYDNMLF